MDNGGKWQTQRPHAGVQRLAKIIAAKGNDDSIDAPHARGQHGCRTPDRYVPDMRRQIGGIVEKRRGLGMAAQHEGFGHRASMSSSADDQ